MTRTINSLRNIKYTLAGRIVSLILSFVSRTVFINYLGVEYLGLNGLFTNVLSILSLAELGIGSAIAYSIYEPLARGEENRLKSLMQIYRKAYNAIGVWMFASGVLLMPFIDFFIKDMPDIREISIIYILFVINSSITYFISYKRALIIADQNKYIDSLYLYGSQILLNVVQIITLILYKNYVLFLLLKVIATVLENVLISIKADKMYPYLKDTKVEKLDREDKSKIVKNIKAMFLHRVGGIVVMGTDNLLISKFVGISYVGIYSNYLLIVNTLNMLIDILFQSVTASIGNLGVTSDKKRINDIFDSIDFIGYWVYCFTSITFFILINPFISIWLGNEFLFSPLIVLMITINLYIQGLRKSVLTFRDALGLFWYDRYKPIIESAINLIASIYFAINLGVLGILLGTVVSTLTTATWIEPYVLYKNGLKNPVIDYFKKYIKRFILTILIGGVTWFFCSLVLENPLPGFLIKMIICTIIPNVILIVIYHRTSEFKFVLQKAKYFLKR